MIVDAIYIPAIDGFKIAVMVRNCIIIPVAPVRENILVRESRRHMIWSTHSNDVNEYLAITFEKRSELLEGIGEIANMTKDSDREDFVKFLSELRLVQISFMQSEST